MSPQLDDGYAQRQADRIKAYDDAMAAAHADSMPHLTRKAIDACDRCDEDGYRNGVVCDHVNRSDIAARGAAACRAALSKLPNS
jgi:hypothetical protein